MAKRTKLPAKRSTTLSRREAVKLVKPRAGKPVKLIKPKHPPPLKTGKMGAAPKVVVKRRRKMATKPYGSDDNGDKATKADASKQLTQDQVDLGVKVLIDADPKIAKPDKVVRDVDAAVHGYEQKPAAE